MFNITPIVVSKHPKKETGRQKYVTNGTGLNFIKFNQIVFMFTCSTRGTRVQNFTKGKLVIILITLARSDFVEFKRKFILDYILQASSREAKGELARKLRDRHMRPNILTFECRPSKSPAASGCLSCQIVPNQRKPYRFGCLVFRMTDFSDF